MGGTHPRCFAERARKMKKAGKLSRRGAQKSAQGYENRGDELFEGASERRKRDADEVRRSQARLPRTILEVNHIYIIYFMCIRTRVRNGGVFEYNRGESLRFERENHKLFRVRMLSGAVRTRLRCDIWKSTIRTLVTALRQAQDEPFGWAQGKRGCGTRNLSSPSHSVPSGHPPSISHLRRRCRVSSLECRCLKHHGFPSPI